MEALQTEGGDGGDAGVRDNELVGFWIFPVEEICDVGGGLVSMFTEKGGVCTECGLAYLRRRGAPRRG